MDDLIKTFAPPLIEALTPVIMLLLTAAGTQLMAALRKKFDGEAEHALLAHVERAANIAVRELEQTMLPKLRETLADDGKIDAGEIARLKDHAMTRVKTIIGSKARKQLMVQNHGGSDMIVVSAIESAVHTLKAEKRL